MIDGIGDLQVINGRMLLLTVTPKFGRFELACYFKAMCPETIDRMTFEDNDEVLIAAHEILAKFDHCNDFEDAVMLVSNCFEDFRSKEATKFEFDRKIDIYDAAVIASSTNPPIPTRYPIGPRK